MGIEFHEKDDCVKGPVTETFWTGDAECNAYSNRYRCGGIYHNNYMDIVGNRDHDCWWDCSRCHKKRMERKNEQK